MTNQTIQHLAREMAGTFYENQRAPKFRQTFPSAQKYVAAYWPYFVSAARHVMAHMLGRSDVHQNLKDAMADSLIDDRERQLKSGGRRLRQRSPFDADEKKIAQV